MSLSQLNQLKRAEKLFDEGKLGEALEIFNDWSQLEGLSLQQKKYYQFLKGMILVYQHNIEEVIKFGEQILKEGQKYNDHLQSFDGLYFIIYGKVVAKFDEKLEDVHKLLEKIEASFRLISNVSKKDLIQREARLNLLKGHFYTDRRNTNLAEKCIEKVFSVERELANSF